MSAAEQSCSASAYTAHPASAAARSRATALTSAMPARRNRLGRLTASALSPPPAQPPPSRPRRVRAPLSSKSVEIERGLSRGDARSDGFLGPFPKLGTLG